MYPWGIDGMVDESKCSLHTCKKWTAKNMRQHRNCKIGCGWSSSSPFKLLFWVSPNTEMIASLWHPWTMVSWWKAKKLLEMGNVGPFCSLATACRSSSMCSRKRPWAASRRHSRKQICDCQSWLFFKDERLGSPGPVVHSLLVVLLHLPLRHSGEGESLKTSVHIVQTNAVNTND